MCHSLDYKHWGKGKLTADDIQPQIVSVLNTLAFDSPLMREAVREYILATRHNIPTAREYIQHIKDTWEYDGQNNSFNKLVSEVYGLIPA